MQTHTGNCIAARVTSNHVTVTISVTVWPWPFDLYRLL